MKVFLISVFSRDITRAAFWKFVLAKNKEAAIAQFKIEPVDSVYCLEMSPPHAENYLRLSQMLKDKANELVELLKQAEAEP